MTIVTRLFIDHAMTKPTSIVNAVNREGNNPSCITEYSCIIDKNTSKILKSDISLRICLPAMHKGCEDGTRIGGEYSNRDRKQQRDAPKLSFWKRRGSFPSSMKLKSNHTNF